MRAVADASRQPRKGAVGGPAKAGARRDAICAANAESPGLGWIERMREYRGFRERATPVAADIDAMARRFRQERDALGDVIDVWNEVSPAGVRPHVRISGLASGTLTLATPSSSAGYELTRELRNGLERTLVQRLPGRVRRVRVKVGAADAE
jgi:hypothetical protein